MNGEKCIQGIYNYCTLHLSSHEIWPDFYKVRYEEFKRFQKLFPQNHFSRVLEIGCGIGYQAAFFSCISDRVIASDIDMGNMIKHSRGLNATRNFLKKIPVSNIEIVNAHAENLPFSDETFDFVYSSFSLQYTPDKIKALAEIRRVLSKDGYFFCVLPTTSYQLVSAKKYYISAIRKLITKNRRKEKQNEETPGHKATNTTGKRSKLLPPPDDESNNYFSELLAYSPLRWRKLFKSNDHHILLEKRDSTSIIFMTKK